MKTKKSEKGQALILIVFAIIGLIGLTALAVDGGNAYAERRNAQNAADSTALAAALSKVRGGDLNALTTAGLARAASNGYTDGNAGAASTDPMVNVEIYNAPIDGIYTGDDHYIQVKITATVKTYFGGVVGIRQLTNTVQAIARVVPGVSSPLAFGDAVVGLAPHKCKAVLYNGSSNVNIVGSGLFVNSDCDPAFFNNSNSPGTYLTTPCLTAVGTINAAPGSVIINPPNPDCPSQGAASWGYPPSNIIMPDPQCTGNATVSPDGTTMSPGTYSGAFPPNGVTTLQSGIYCVDAGNHGFTISGQQPLTGHGVVIRMDSGKVTINGGANIDLTAPTSGPYAGLLIYLPMSNTSPVDISGNGSLNLVGSILAPASDITLSGGSGTTALHTQAIGFTVTLTGSSELDIVYNSGEQYKPPTPPTIELVQ